MPKVTHNPTMKKLKASANDLQFIMDQYLESQMIGLKVETETDVELILPDGKIPCHAVILKAVSPFFEEIFKTQGEFFPGIRQISMPDFSVHVMNKVIQLVYDSEVVVQSTSEADQVKATIKLLDICSSQKLNKEVTNCRDHRQTAYLITNCAIPEDLHVLSKLSTIDIPKLVHVVESPVSQSTIKDNIKVVSPKRNLRRRPTPVKKIIVYDCNSESDRDGDVYSDNLPSASSESEDDSDQDKQKRKSRGSIKSSKSSNNPGKRTEINDCLTALNKLSNPNDEGSANLTKTNFTVKEKIGSSKPTGLSSSRSSIKSSSSTSSKVITTPKPVPVPSVAKVQRNRTIPLSVGGTSQSSDEESKGELSDGPETDSKSLTNLETLQAEAKKCQKCNKSYGSLANASKCLVDHNLVRCYLCFEVHENTDELFEHFSSEHENAGRENYLICPYCDQSIPFKSVSCHVISKHLSGKAKPMSTGGNRNVSNGKAGRPSTNVVVEPPAKKPKPNEEEKEEDIELKVSDLDCTIRQKSGRNNGKVWKFHLSMSRSSKSSTVINPC